MITPSEREQFKTLVGNHYFGKLNTLLKERGVINSKGKAYTRSMISMVLNGERPHPAIEDAIRSLSKEKLHEINQAS